jgi:hypothetical protein
VVAAILFYGDVDLNCIGMWPRANSIGSSYLVHGSGINSELNQVG